jgi:hypothetical protein
VVREEDEIGSQVKIFKSPAASGGFTLMKPFPCPCSALSVTIFAAGAHRAGAAALDPVLPSPYTNMTVGNYLLRQFLRSAQRWGACAIDRPSQAGPFQADGLAC